MLRYVSKTAEYMHEYAFNAHECRLVNALFTTFGKEKLTDSFACFGCRPVAASGGAPAWDKEASVMTNRRHQGIGNDGTLDRLNDALSALENRIAGTSRSTNPPRERYGLDDIAGIKEREAALRLRSNRPQAVGAQRSEFDSIRDKLLPNAPPPTRSGSGVSELRAGNRHTLGVVFHDAR